MEIIFFKEITKKVALTRYMPTPKITESMTTDEVEAEIEDCYFRGFWLVGGEPVTDEMSVLFTDAYGDEARGASQECVQSCEGLARLIAGLPPRPYSVQ